MNRRSWFASLFAPVVARWWPETSGQEMVRKMTSASNYLYLQSEAVRKLMTQRGPLAPIGKQDFRLPFQINRGGR